MPTKVLLSTDAAVEEEVLPLAAKKRVKAGNAKPFIPEKKIKEEARGDGEDGEGEEDRDDRDDRDDKYEGPPVKKRKQKGPRPKVYLCTYTDPTTNLPCTAAFSRPCRLREHTNTHTNTRPFVCPHCGNAFYRQTHLKTHIKQTHSQTRSHTCPHPDCGKTYATKQHLNRHLETHGKEQRHICTGYSPCTEGFRKKTQLERHIRVAHLGVGGWVCKYLLEAEEEVKGGGKMCGESFETKGKLSGHIEREHGTGNKYFCEECTVGKDGEVVSRSCAVEGVNVGVPGMDRGTIMVWPEDEVPSESKRVRRSTRNPNKRPKYTNDIESELNETLEDVDDSDCDPDFKIDESHHKSHSQDQRQAFPYPTTTTGSTPALTTTTTPFTAPTATTTTATQPLGFKTWSSYQHHLRVYHPPICLTCGKICLSNRDLRVHIHENHAVPLSERAKKNVCPYEECNGNGFARKWGLTVHIKTVHEGEKKYICPKEGCGRGFGHKGSMEVHFKRHFGTVERTGGGQPRMGAGQGGSSEAGQNGDDGTGESTRRRGGMSKEESTLLERLTGVGYERGRDIPCTLDGCEYRFRRRYDLCVHLEAAHEFLEGQVAEVMQEMEGGWEEEEEEEEDDEKHGLGGKSGMDWMKEWEEREREEFRKSLEERNREGVELWDLELK
ncbi:hypothetical protein EV426DRAFT_702841 [Tirmania nivea]|nr:hypothetical protein EV426DRAFT_702841 [Tirmania nivea]